MTKSNCGILIPYELKDSIWSVHLLTKFFNIFLDGEFFLTDFNQSAFFCILSASFILSKLSIGLALLFPALAFGILSLFPEE